VVLKLKLPTTSGRPNDSIDPTSNSGGDAQMASFHAMLYGLIEPTELTSFGLPARNQSGSLEREA